METAKRFQFFKCADCSRTNNDGVPELDIPDSEVWVQPEFGVPLCESCYENRAESPEATLKDEK